MARDNVPSIDGWLREAKELQSAGKIGMYLIHNGVVRATAKALARYGKASDNVIGMSFSYDAEKVAAAKAKAEALPGIELVRVWLNEGELHVGDDLMYVLIGGDIRPNVIAALESFVSELKNDCVTETERFKAE